VYAYKIVYTCVLINVYVVYVCIYVSIYISMYVIICGCIPVHLCVRVSMCVWLRVTAIRAHSRDLDLIPW